MTLQERITTEYHNVMKSGNTDLRLAYRFLIGELQRQPSKIITDDQVISIFRKLIKSLTDNSKSLDENKVLLDLIDTFIPQLADREIIKLWINQNINFDNYKNKMQAMKDIMAHFGKLADGNVVKSILEERV